MNVKDLIAVLQTMPQDATVNCHGEPIWFVESLPGYFDGHYNELILDGGGYPAGYRFCRDGEKVIIRTIGMTEIIRYTAENSKELPKVPYATMECRGILTQKRIDEFTAIFNNVMKEVSDEEKVEYMQEIVDK